MDVKERSNETAQLPPAPGQWPRWTRTERDGNGRLALEAKPAFGGGGNNK